MPGKVKVQILAGRNLPVMDKTNETSDAYVEVKLGGTTYKTDVCRKSLNPIWNSEWFKFEVDDEELQDEPLQIRIMDHDTYSANDAIGKVYVNLNPLLLSSHSGCNLAGWIPIYDTMHGIRGEVNVNVKVDYFSDFNRFRQSSCGVPCYYCPGIPYGHKLHIIHGFVEELVANEDPEYHWMDKLRTPRASNEARQTVFAKLSGEVQRKIGLKTLELGGNAVIGYQQCFDLEGESGVTVRGIGTAATLVRQVHDNVQLSPCPPKESSQELFYPDNTCFLSDSNELSPTRLCFFPNLLIPPVYVSRPTSCMLFKNVPPLPPSGETKHKILRSRFHSLTPSGLHATTRPPPRLLLPPPSVTSRHITRFRQRSQSSSATLQDERSLALNQFVSEHQEKLESDVASGGMPSKKSGSDGTDEDVFVASSCASETDSSIPPSPTDATYDRSSAQLLSSAVSTANMSVASDSVSWQRDPSSSKCVVQPRFLSESPLCRRSPLPDDSPGSPITHIPNKLSQSPIKCNVPCICRRSSDTELNIMAKGSCNTNGTTKMMSRTENIEMLEYPFLSMTQFPPSFIIHLGGVVAAQSVKLLGRVNNPEELESRDAWWKEIRMEIRSHARALGCNVVLGYSESTSICDDVCILSATGTAAVVCMYHAEGENFRKEFSALMPDKKDLGDEKTFTTGTRTKHLSDGDEHGNACKLCHIPYSEASIPFAVLLSRCAICRKSKVPDILFTTISPPPLLPISGRGSLIQARVCKAKKEGKGEVNAKEISDSLPFLQYELHRQLLNKLKMKGMNGLFELRIQISVSAKMIIAVATATAVFLTALPPQQLPRVSSGTVPDDAKLQALKKQITETMKKNCEFYNILHLTTGHQSSDSVKSEFEDESDEDELPELDLNAGNKDACILEMDDSEDADIISFLVDANPPDGFEVVNTERIPGFDTAVRNLQMFTRIFRTKFSSGSNLTCRQLTQYCENALQSLFFKLRKMIPCSLCKLQFRVELPEDDEIQLTLLGMALGLGDPSVIRNKTNMSLLKTNDLNDGANAMTNSDEDISSKSRSTIDIPDKKLKFHTPTKERYGVDITPLSYIPGIPIERYLGNLNFFFIRESTSIKEFGGMSGFVQSFIADALAIARAHVVALGGNALLSYFLNEYVLLQNPHKNQGQCLINFGGDVVHVSNPLSLQHPTTLTHSSSSSSCMLMPLKGTFPTPDPKEMTSASTPISLQG